MEKLIKFLKESNLLDRSLSNLRIITIDMTKEEFEQDNFFSDYINKQCNWSIPVEWSVTKEEVKNIKSITSPIGFKLKINIV